MRILFSKSQITSARDKRDLRCTFAEFFGGSDRVDFSDEYLVCFSLDFRRCDARFSRLIVIWIGSSTG